jgi:DNA-binding beta-propeller fold protein YncE
MLQSMNKINLSARTFKDVSVGKFRRMRILISNLFLLVFIITSSNCAAQSTPAKSLLALSKGDHIMAIVDPVTFKVIARVPVGPDPHEVIASSDGKTAYVSNAYSSPFQEIDMIDLITQKPLPKIDIKPLLNPHGLMYADGKLWFSAEGSKCVGRVDPASAQVDWCLGTGQDRTHMIYVTPDAKNIYTTNVNAGTVSIIVDTLLPPPVGPNGQPNPAARSRREWIQTVVPVSKGSEGFDVSPDGRELWTASAQDGTISIIDIAARNLSAKLDAKALGANRLKFTPDGKRVLVSSLRNGDLIVYDVASRKELKRLNLGHGAAGILVDTDGSRAFIGCTADNYVAVVDLKTLEVTSHIDIGGGPDGLAWAVRP